MRRPGETALGDPDAAGVVTDREPVEAVVFDVNGVLIESMGLHTTLNVDLLAAAGVEVTEAEAGRHMGRSGADFFRAIAAETGADVDAAALAERKRRALLDRIDDVSLVPGAGAALRSLAQGYRVGVASNDHRECVEAVLDRLDVTAAVGAVVTIDDVEAGKPDPECYRRVTDRLGVAPAAAVAVEDSPHGLTAARAAGLRTVGVRTAADVDLGQATESIDRLSRLPTTIAGMDRE